MKRLRLEELVTREGRHVLDGFVPAERLTYCGAGFKKPGERTHDTGCTCTYCDGHGRHAHAFHETFIVLQGDAVMEVNGEKHAMRAGDAIISEPGEDHHFVAGGGQCLYICLH